MCLQGGGGGGADAGSNHHLVKAVLKLKIRPNAPVSTNRPTRYNLHLLSDVGISKEFSIKVRNRFQILEVQQTSDIDAEMSVKVKWSHVKEAYHSTSNNVLGIKKRQHKEWISLETLDCIKRRRTLKNKISQTKSERQRDRLRIEYAELNKLVKKGVRADKRWFMEELAETAEKSSLQK